MGLPGGAPLAALAAVASLATLTACAGSSSGPASTTSTPQTSHGAFGDCMRAHGIPDPPHSPVGPPSGVAQPPGPGGTPQAPPGGTAQAPPGVDQATWDSAMRACGSLAPAAPGPRG
ncbi:hypothetical protein [Mycobacterium sp.]|uniref:hypothetical protein n=1 Tax=Mycobacterium sp. TaxID=1785 RepID=UPI002D600A2A|nr:hypothetical protein [Mycobacterium sp.]HZA12180.1 hypothetical protein [Mycobacterium sp.]